MKTITRKLRGYVCSPLNAPTVEGIENNMKKAANYCNIVAEKLDVEPKCLHHMLPKILNDNAPEERALALKWGLELLTICDRIYVCGNRISVGMMAEIKKAYDNQIDIICFNKDVWNEIKNENIPATLKNVEGLGA